MFRIMCTVLGAVLAAALVAGTAQPMWEVLQNQDVDRFGELLRRTFTSGVPGLVGAAIGGIAGYVVGETLGWVAHLGGSADDD